MLIKTSELQGAALDWAVAKCEWGRRYNGNADLVLVARTQKYSTDWAQGGPIIEREGVTVEQQYRLNSPTDWWANLAWLDEQQAEGFGPTPLIAAMRCYVASKMGDEIEVPEGLL